MNFRKRQEQKNKTTWPQCLGGILLFLFAGCSPSKQKVDLIVHNATIYTVDSAFSTAQSFAVKDGKFIAVGTNDAIMNTYEATETVDASGQFVYPGFIDSHCHFYEFGRGTQQADLTGTTSFEDVLERLEYFYDRNPVSVDTTGEKWLIGRGWDQNDWKIKEFPDREKLDSLFPHTPVFIERIDGHAALANTAALQLAGITAETKIAGGVIGITAKPDGAKGTGAWRMQNADGRPIHRNGYVTMPNGILIDNAVELVRKVIPKPTKEDIKNALLTAQSRCFAVGLTTVDDAGLEKNIIDNMDALHKNGELKMRIYAMLTDNKENADYYLARGPYKTDRLNVRSFKYYADGALGSRGACLLQPYSDRPNESGFLLNTPEHFADGARAMIESGFQMNTHCIGDSAVHLIAMQYKLRIAIKGLSKNLKPVDPHEDFSKRWRIEHFQVTTKEDLKFLADLPEGYIVPSVQPTHATSDMYWAEERLGKERMKYAYAYNDLLKAAGKIALGTDFPVEKINPLYTFYAAVARKDLKGFPEGGFQMENALSREDALRGMTIWGAYANFEEKEKGSIEVGKFADFILLNTDIMKCQIDLVPHAKLRATYVNGEKVLEIITIAEKKNNPKTSKTL